MIQKVNNEGKRLLLQMKMKMATSSIELIIMKLKQNYMNVLWGNQMNLL